MLTHTFFSIPPKGMVVVVVRVAVRGVGAASVADEGGEIEEDEGEGGGSTAVGEEGITEVAVVEGGDEEERVPEEDNKCLSGWVGGWGREGGNEGREGNGR